MSFLIMAAVPMLIHSFCRNEARIIRPGALSLILPRFAAHPDSCRAHPARRRRRLPNPYLRAACRAALAPSGTAAQPTSVRLRPPVIFHHLLCVSTICDFNTSAETANAPNERQPNEGEVPGEKDPEQSASH
jgi:hypothetical protein